MVDPRPTSPGLLATVRCPDLNANLILAIAQVGPLHLPRAVRSQLAAVSRALPLADSAVGRVLEETAIMPVR